MSIFRTQIRAALKTPPRAIELDSFRVASVAAILTLDDVFVFMRRAEHDTDPWSGHISFPGGRQEPSDATDLDAAIRETEEEIGVDLRGAEYLGRLDDIRTIQPLPPILIRPHLFFLNDPLSPTLNEEVASLHLLSVSDLLNDVGRTTMEHPWRGTERQFPCIEFDDVRLWGLTLHMVDDLLHRIDGRGRGLERITHQSAKISNAFDPREGDSWSR